MRSQTTLLALASVDRDVMDARAREFLTLLDKGDYAQLRTFLAPSATCDLSGGFALKRHAPRCEGIEAIATTLRDCHRDYESLGSRIDDMFIEDERVVVRRTVRLRHRGTSALATVFIIHFFRFTDGLVCDLVEYADTAALERLSSGFSFH